MAIMLPKYLCIFISNALVETKPAAANTNCEVFYRMHRKEKICTCFGQCLLIITFIIQVYRLEFEMCYPPETICVIMIVQVAYI